jgi:hypothetical protein
MWGALGLNFTDEGVSSNKGFFWKGISIIVMVFLLFSTTYLFFQNLELKKQKPPETMKQETLEAKNATSSENLILDVVSETEYSINDTGQFIIRLTDSKSNPLTSALCFGSIAYPDKTIFIENQSMTPSAFAGNYYFEFTVPSIHGVYEEMTTCYVNVSWGLAKVTKASSFHVNDLKETIIASNTSIMNKLNEINNHITAIENNIINKIEERYNDLYTLYSSISSQVTNLQTTSGKWWVQIAQKITGVNQPFPPAT